MPQKLLVIDDSKLVHSLVIARLKDEDLEIISAPDGRAGLELARTVDPDAILLDIEMPQHNGFEICAKLKEDPRTAGVPVIFLSAVNSVEEKIKGLDLGAVDYVTKPFDAAELKARVRACLRTKRLTDLLSRRAMIDGLTELWNRGQFEARLDAETSLAKRIDRPLACVMGDVDHFKSINDRFGHPFGDKVLRQVAGVFTASCRKEDLVCRYGGEEFVVLCPNTGAAEASLLAERIRAGVAELLPENKGEAVKVTLSLGVAELATSEHGLVGSADAALYSAKKGGRNRVVTAASMPIPVAA